MSSERFPVVIHHNPDCGTSRNVVEIVRAAGYDPIIIEYLTAGWTRPHCWRCLPPRASPRALEHDAEILRYALIITLAAG